MDLARLKGVSLAEATTTITSAMGGRTAALKKLGIEVQKGATQEQILAAITKVAGGQAEAYAGTSAGKMAAAHVKVREAMEKLGAITDRIVQNVLPVLADAFDHIMDAVGPVLDQLGEAMPGILANFGKAVNWLSKNVLPTVRDLLGWIGKNVLPALAKAFDWIGKNVMPAVGKAFDWAAKNVIPALGKAFEWIQKNVIPPLGAIFNWIAKDVMPALGSVFEWISKNVLPYLSRAFGNLNKYILQPLGQVINWIVKNVLPPLNDALGWISKNVIPALGAAMDTAKGAFKSLGDTVSAIWSGISSAVKGAINIVIGAIDALIGGINAVQLHIDLKPPVGPELKFDYNGPNIGKIPYLHRGGVVPGAAGSDVLAMLQAGERVVPRSQVNNTTNGGHTFIINNPTAETASKSVFRANLKLATMGYRSG
jgi:phage-related protein